MESVFHSAAVENFDTKADSLIRLIETAPRADRARRVFEGMHVAGCFAEKDIVGDLEESVTDYRGRTAGRFFLAGDRRCGIQGANYQELRKLAEQIQKLPKLHRSVSTEFVETALFRWLQRAHEDRENSGPFTAFISARVAESVRPPNIWTPLANLVVDQPFELGLASVVPLSAKRIDEWEQAARSSGSSGSSDRTYFNDIRRRFQGYAAVVTRVTAESEMAVIESRRQSRLAMAVLAIYSPANLLPDIRCNVNPKGTEFVPEEHVLVQVGDGVPNYRAGILTRDAFLVWHIDAHEIHRMYRKNELAKASSLLKKERLSGFERAVLDFLLLYSRAAFAADPVEKIVHALAGLESLLLRNQSEPIQQNLAERMAMFSTNDASARKEIVKVVRSIYNVRSRFLHHGSRSADLDTVAQFLFRTWIFFLTLMLNLDLFSDKEQFLDNLDDRKFA